MNTNSIEAIRIGKKYADFELKDVSFALPQGCIMGFVGENGAGKTTTIKRLLGLIEGTGTVKLLGVEGGGRDNGVKQQLGVVLDNSFFSDYLRAQDIDAILKRLYQNWDSMQFRAYLDRFEIPRGKLLRELSKGMKTKVQIATALSHHAKLLILDEPTSGLDPVARSEVIDLFLEFIQDEQNSIFLSSHITADLEKIADYITFIHRGQLVFSDVKDLLLEQYGIAKGEAEQLNRLEQGLVLARRHSQYSCEALVRDRAAAQAQCPLLTVDPPTLDDIMLFIVRGEK